MAAVERSLTIIAVIISVNTVSIITTYLTNFDDITKYRLVLVQGYVAIQGILFFLALFIWTRVRVGHGFPSILKTVLLLLYIILLVSAQCSLILGHVFSSVEPYWISYLAYICLGIFILVVTLTLISETLLYIADFISRKSCYGRTFVLKFKIVLVTVFSLILCIISLHNVTQGPRIVRVTVPVQNLPSVFNGTVFIHLSDIHVGPTVGKSMVENVVKTTNRLRPDAVFITGDLVDSTVSRLAPALTPFQRINAPLGVYFVTGNHEYYTGDIDAWLEELPKYGIVTLHNSNVLLSHPNNNQAHLYLAGADDREGTFLRSGSHGMNLTKALASRKLGIPTILLVHQPKAAKQALEYNPPVDLILCGHTHGGQLFPLHLWHIFQPYFQGLYRDGKAVIYVSSGVFYWGMPMRLFSRAEIVHVTLVSANMN